MDVLLFIDDGVDVGLYLMDSVIPVIAGWHLRNSSFRNEPSAFWDESRSRRRCEVRRVDTSFHTADCAHHFYESTEIANSNPHRRFRVWIGCCVLTKESGNPEIHI